VKQCPPKYWGAVDNHIPFLARHSSQASTFGEANTTLRRHNMPHVVLGDARDGFKYLNDASARPVSEVTETQDGI